MDTLKTIQDIIEASGFKSRAFIYRQIKQGKLAPPLKIGRSSRWKESDIKAWLDTLENEATRGFIDLSNATKAAKEARAKKA